MTAARWNSIRAATLAYIAEHQPEFPWSDEQQGFIDAAVDEILERESAMRAAIDITVRRTLGLGVPLLRCPITACVEPCGAPLTTLGYAHNPQGNPGIGFTAYQVCAKGHRMWGPLL
jgi:hypothetical protein